MPSSHTPRIRFRSSRIHPLCAAEASAYPRKGQRRHFSGFNIRVLRAQSC
jgi:hypothetical protein